MTQTDWIKIGVNLFVGFLTLLLQNFIPIGGGGISLIFVLTVPTTIGLSLLSSLLYIWLTSIKKQQTKNFIYYLVLILNLFITFAMYPYG